MSKPHFKTSKLFNKFLKFTLGNYLKLLFNIKIDNSQIIGLEPPYIILANHTNFWDPFMLSLCIDEPVCFVTSDAYFRNPCLKWLLGLVGSIPKTKMVSDPSTIRGILTIVKNKGIIGIFPEGNRNWDGVTLPLHFPTAKLIKSLKLPVISILFNGAYLSMPRWAKKPRRGELKMTCEKIFESYEIDKLSIDEIYHRMTDKLSYDEYAYQKAHMIAYNSKIPAETLELFLFCCPDCKTIGKMKSYKSNFSCSNCGYIVTYDKYGYFHSLSEHLFFTIPNEWDNWQQSYLNSEIKKSYSESTSKPIFQDRNVNIFTGSRAEPLKVLGKGTLLLFSSEIIFISNKTLDNKIVFDISKISGETVQSNSQLEFYYDKVLYRFIGDPIKISAYKWLKSIENIKNILVRS